MCWDWNSTHYWWSASLTLVPPTRDCLYLVLPSQECPQMSACAVMGARRRRTPQGPPDPSCRTRTSDISTNKSSHPQLALQSDPLCALHTNTWPPSREPANPHSPPSPPRSLNVSMDTAGNEGALTPRRHWLLPAGCSEVIAFTRLLWANQNEGAGSRGTDLRGGTPFALRSPSLPPSPSCGWGAGGNVSALLALVSVRIKVFSSCRVAATVII